MELEQTWKFRTSNLPEQSLPSKTEPRTSWTTQKRLNLEPGLFQVYHPIKHGKQFFFEQDSSLYCLVILISEQGKSISKTASETEMNVFSIRILRVVYTLEILREWFFWMKSQTFETRNSCFFQTKHCAQKKFFYYTLTLKKIVLIWRKLNSHDNWMVIFTRFSTNYFAIICTDIDVCQCSSFI